MRQTSWLTVVLALLGSAALTGCFGKNSKSTIAGTGTGSTTAGAALELTRAVSFAGGSLKDSLLPPASASDVTLTPAPGGPVQPGDTALLSFDVDDPRAGDPVTTSLIQFGDTSQHFEVPVMVADAGAGAGNGGDGGTRGDASATTQTFTLHYTIDPDVCVKLCDTTFKIKIVEAVKLKGGKISAHAFTTIDLDCTKQGDHALCPGSSPASADAAAPSNAPKMGGAITNAYGTLQTEICKCSKTGKDSSCAFSMEQAKCSMLAFDNHAADVVSTAACIEKYLGDQKACVTAAACDPVKLAKCDYVINSRRASMTNADGGMPDPIETRCGIFPSTLKNELDNCSPNTNQMSTFQCATGEILTIDKLCNGVMDCKDNGDESNICLSCADGKSTYPTAKQCDGTPDCADGSDEATCTFQCKLGGASISVKNVCDGLPDCTDASDEANCKGDAGVKAP